MSAIVLAQHLVQSGQSNITSATERKAQTFTTVLAGYLTGIDLKLSTAGVSGTATVNVYLNNTADDNPTGPVLATSTINITNIGEFPPEVVSFPFDQTVLLADATEYFIEFLVDTVGTTNFGLDTASGYGGGQAMNSSDNGATYTSLSGFDAYFVVDADTVQAAPIGGGGGLVDLTLFGSWGW